MTVNAGMTGRSGDPFQAQAVDEAGGEDRDERSQEEVRQAGTESPAATEKGFQRAAHEPLGGTDEADAAEESTQALGEGIEARVHGEGHTVVRITPKGRSS